MTERWVGGHRSSGAVVQFDCGPDYLKVLITPDSHPGPWIRKQFLPIGVGGQLVVESTDSMRAEIASFFNRHIAARQRSATE